MATTITPPDAILISEQQVKSWEHPLMVEIAQVAQTGSDTELDSAVLKALTSGEIWGTFSSRSIGSLPFEDGSTLAVRVNDAVRKATESLPTGMKSARDGAFFFFVNPEQARQIQIDWAVTEAIAAERGAKVNRKTTFVPVRRAGNDIYAKATLEAATAG